MDLRKQQLKVGKGAAAAAVLSVVFIASGYYWFPFHLPELPTMGDRLAFTMRGELFAALILLAAIGTVGNQRALSAEAIDGSTVLTGSIDINRRVLQNTLEQLMLALFEPSLSRHVRLYGCDQDYSDFNYLVDFWPNCFLVWLPPVSLGTSFWFRRNHVPDDCGYFL
jgi:hypothetical protein